MRRSFNIVAADSDQQMRDYYQELLSGLGHHVMVAESGSELAGLARTRHPDLILAEARMADVDGITAGARVNAERLTPVILVSADYNAEQCGRSVLPHVVSCLIKPINPQDLAMAIDLAMTRFEHEQALRNEAAELRRALAERKIIEQAKGAVMHRIGLDEPDAYRQLRRLSSNCNRKLVEVARDVIVADEVFQGLDDPHGPNDSRRPDRETARRRASRDERSKRKRRPLPCGAD